MLVDVHQHFRTPDRSLLLVLLDPVRQDNLYITANMRHVTTQKSGGVFIAVEACNPKLTDFSVLRRQTQQNPELLNTLNASSLYGSRFNASHPTKIIIHGFAGGRHLSPSTDLRDGMLVTRDSHCSSLTTLKDVLSERGYKLKSQFFWDVMTCQLEIVPELSKDRMTSPSGPSSETCRYGITSKSVKYTAAPL
jgi:hypothetical protein